MFMVIFIEKRKYICLLSVTRFEYDEYGRQLQIDDPSAGGQTYTYDTDGLPTGRSATRAGVTVFAQGYSFDAGTGNLEERTDETRGLAELFTYDHLNRLTGWQVQQDGTGTLEVYASSDVLIIPLQLLIVRGDGKADAKT